MAQVTAFTAARSKEIEDRCIVSGAVDLNGYLQLTQYDGTIRNAGMVRGPKGDDGSNAVINPVEIVTGTNLNDVIAIGNYWQSQNVEAPLALNYPLERAGWLEVYANESGSELLQRYTTHDSAWVFLRHLFNGVWGPWRCVFRMDTDTNFVTMSGANSAGVNQIACTSMVVTLDLQFTFNSTVPANPNGNITNITLGRIMETTLRPKPGTQPPLSTSSTGLMVMGCVTELGDVIISALVPDTAIATNYTIRVGGSWPFHYRIGT